MFRPIIWFIIYKVAKNHWALFSTPQCFEVNNEGVPLSKFTLNKLIRNKLHMFQLLWLTNEMSKSSNDVLRDNTCICKFAIYFQGFKPKFLDLHWNQEMTPTSHDDIPLSLYILHKRVEENSNSILKTFIESKNMQYFLTITRHTQCIT